MAIACPRAGGTDGDQDATGGFGARTIGALGLLLATAGAFGVFAYAVEERRREIGIRLALVGRALQVVRSVWTTSLRAGAAGVAAGLLLAAAAAQLLRSFLYGLSPFDAVVYVQIAGILFAAGALATWIPARRATRVDPAVTLRSPFESGFGRSARRFICYSNMLYYDPCRTTFSPVSSRRAVPSY